MRRHWKQGARLAALCEADNGGETEAARAQHVTLEVGQRARSVVAAAAAAPGAHIELAPCFEGSDDSINVSLRDAAMDFQDIVKVHHQAFALTKKERKQVKQKLIKK